MSLGESAPTTSKTGRAERRARQHALASGVTAQLRAERVASAADDQQRAGALRRRRRLAQHVAAGPVRLAAVVEHLEDRGHGREVDRGRDDDRVGRVEQRVDVVHAVAHDALARRASRRCSRGTARSPTSATHERTGTPPAVAHAARRARRAAGRCCRPAAGCRRCTARAGAPCARRRHSRAVPVEQRERRSVRVRGERAGALAARLGDASAVNTVRRARSCARGTAPAP